jgi:hypothetical protein
MGKFLFSGEVGGWRWIKLTTCLIETAFQASKRVGFWLYSTYTVI